MRHVAWCLSPQLKGWTREHITHIRVTFYPALIFPILIRMVQKLTLTSNICSWIKCFPRRNGSDFDPESEFKSGNYLLKVHYLAFSTMEKKLLRWEQCRTSVGRVMEAGRSLWSGISTHRGGLSQMLRTITLTAARTFRGCRVWLALARGVGTPRLN